MPQTVAIAFANAAAGGAAATGAAGVVTVGSAFATGAAVGAAYVVGYAVGTAALIGGSMAVSAALAPSIREDMAGRLNMGMDPHPPRRIIYGKVKVSGPIAFAETATGSQIDQLLITDIVLASHPVFRVFEIYLNDKLYGIKVDGSGEIPPLLSPAGGWDSNGLPRYSPNEDSKFASHVLMKWHTGDQVIADADAVAKTSRIFTDFGNKLTYASLVLWHQSEVFSSGPPKLSALIEGRRDIYDPRIGPFALDSVVTGVDEGLLKTIQPLSGGDVVRFSTTGTMPAPLQAGKIYHVRNAFANSFSVSELFGRAETRVGGFHREGPSPIRLTANGSGTITVERMGGYSDNPALCLAADLTYSREQGGMGRCDYDDIDTDALIDAANDCDELVGGWEGDAQQPRYRCGGTILSTTPAIDRIQAFLSAMGGGNMEKVNGKWVIRAGKYRPSYMTLTEADWQTTPRIDLNTSTKDLANAIRPVLVSEESDGQISDIGLIYGEIAQDISFVNLTTNKFEQPSTPFDNGDRVRFSVWQSGDENRGALPANIDPDTHYYVVNAAVGTFQVSNFEGGSPIDTNWHPGVDTGNIVACYDQFLTEDGERRIMDLEYPFVYDTAQAARCAFIDLKRMRAQVSINVVAGLRAFALQVGDTVRVLDWRRGFYAADGGSKTAQITGGKLVLAAGTISEGAPFIFSPVAPAGLSVDKTYYAANVAGGNTFDVVEFAGGNQPLPLTGTWSDEVQPVIGKLFLVEGWDFGLHGGRLGVGLQMREANDNDWSWDGGLLTRPDPGESITVTDWREVTAPTLNTPQSGTDQLLLQKDGTIITRVKLTWNANPSFLVSNGGRFEVQAKTSAGSVWETVGYTDGAVTIFYYLGAADGVEYDFRVRAINVGGFESDWSMQSNHEVIGKTAPPGPVTVLTATDEIRVVDLEWTNPSDLDLDYILIERNSGSYGIFDGQFETIARLPKWTNRFRDYSAPGRPLSHFLQLGPYVRQQWTYRATAYDTTGNASSQVTTIGGLAEASFSVSTSSGGYNSTTGKVSVVWNYDLDKCDVMGITFTDATGYVVLEFPAANKWAEFPFVPEFSATSATLTLRPGIRNAAGNWYTTKSDAIIITL